MFGLPLLKGGKSSVDRFLWWKRNKTLQEMRLIKKRNQLVSDGVMSGDITLITFLEQHAGTCFIPHLVLIINYYSEALLQKTVMCDVRASNRRAPVCSYFIYDIPTNDYQGFES